MNAHRDAPPAAALAAALADLIDQVVISGDDVAELACRLRGQSAGPGAPVEPFEVLELHSDTIAEDHRRLQLWNLRDGHTAASVDGGPLLRVD